MVTEREKALSRSRQEQRNLAKQAQGQAQAQAQAQHMQENQQVHTCTCIYYTVLSIPYATICFEEVCRNVFAQYNAMFYTQVQASMQGLTWVACLI
jgi:hypothetical protein